MVLKNIRGTIRKEQFFIFRFRGGGPWPKCLLKAHVHSFKMTPRSRRMVVPIKSYGEKSILDIGSRIISTHPVSLSISPSLSPTRLDCSESPKFLGKNLNKSCAQMSSNLHTQNLLNTIKVVVKFLSMIQTNMLLHTPRKLIDITFVPQAIEFFFSQTTVVLKPLFGMCQEWM
jgi:hypothetical protein